MNAPARARAAIAAAVLAAALAVGCSPAPRTQLVLLVESDLAVPAEIDSVRVTVVGTGAPATTMVDLAAAGAPALPLTLGLERARASLGEIAVTVEGWRGGRLRVARVVRAPFVPDQVRTLPVALLRACVDAAPCPEGQSCGEGGACMSTRRAAESLPPWTGAPTPRDDGGVPSSDARADASPPCGRRGGDCCAAAPYCTDPGTSCVASVCVCGAGCPRIAELNFESGRLLDALTGASRTNGAVALETSAPLAGRYSAAIAPSVPNSYLARSFAPVDDLYVAFSLRLRALPAAASSAPVLMLLSGSTFESQLHVVPSGAVQLRDLSGRTVAPDSPLALEVGAVYRVALHRRRGTGSDGLIEAYLSRPGLPFGAPFASAASESWTTGATEVRVGSLGPYTLDAVIDDVVIDRSALP